ncbi:MAG: DUF2852 domain-containing protein [Bauldia sp.]|nr:DUF2852 domain-containing protein [Bauldia sp.]
MTTPAYALRPAWTPLTIALMVIGFIVAWPLGLLMLAYILWGDRIPEIRRHFEGVKRDWSGESRCGPRGFASRSGNAAFDDYREAELKRLDEERRKLEEERREFERYVHDLRRARDKEEFDRFMSDRARRARKGGETIDL